MMYPILCKIRYESLHQVFSGRKIWKQIAFSVFVNWIIAPFLMVCTSFFFLVVLSVLNLVAGPGVGVFAGQA